MKLFKDVSAMTEQDMKETRIAQVITIAMMSILVTILAIGVYYMTSGLI